MFLFDSYEYLSLVKVHSKFRCIFAQEVTFHKLV